MTFAQCALVCATALAIFGGEAGVLYGFWLAVGAFWFAAASEEYQQLPPPGPEQLAYIEARHRHQLAYIEARHRHEIQRDTVRLMEREIRLAERAEAADAKRAEADDAAQH